MKIQKRRKREHKTDYGKRLKLLKSGKPRVVFRASNRYIIAQYIESSDAQDKAKFGVSSKELLKFGWNEKTKGSLKSIPASYLTGFLMGKKVLKTAGDVVLDFGMKRMIYKTRVYAFIKGLKDAGVNVNCDEKFFPNEEKLKGEHMKNKINFNEIKSQVEKA